MHRAFVVIAAVAVVALLGAVSARPVQAQTYVAPPPVILGYHTVMLGETLFCLGRGYHVDPWAIARTNSIVNVNLLYPGQVLAIPNVPASLPPGPTCAPQIAPPSWDWSGCAVYHTVLPGQTLSGIAAMYGIPLPVLAQHNGIANWNVIYAYSTLCIPGR